MKHAIVNTLNDQPIRWTLKVSKNNGDLELRADGNLILYINTDNIINLQTDGYFEPIRKLQVKNKGVWYTKKLEELKL